MIENIIINFFNKIRGNQNYQNNSIDIYTDGSYKYDNGNMCSVGIMMNWEGEYKEFSISYDKNYIYNKYPEIKNSIEKFDIESGAIITEAIAILESLDRVEKFKLKNVNFYTDCFVLFSKIINHRKNSLKMPDILGRIIYNKFLEYKIPIDKLFWIPGHSRIVGNVLCDKIAKKHKTFDNWFKNYKLVYIDNEYIKSELHGIGKYIIINNKIKVVFKKENKRIIKFYSKNSICYEN